MNQKQPLLESPSSCIRILDPYGVPYSASNIARARENDHHEEQNKDSTYKLSRGKFLRDVAIVAGTVVANGFFVPLGTEIVKSFCNDIDMDKPIMEPDLLVTKQMHEVFPFLSKNTPSVRYFPNADNELLKKAGIGYADATLADHLRMHNSRFDFLQNLRQIFKRGHGTKAEDKNDTDIFSYATLLQAHCFHSAIRNEKLFGRSVLGKWHCARSGFSDKNINVIVGSPTGNNLSALIRGKVRRTEVERRRELMHEGVEGLTLPFEFSLDADNDRGVIGKNSEYRWSVYLAEKDGSISDEPFRGNSYSDYLVLSVLPNYLTSGKPPKAWLPLVLIEGCSSLGTNGAKLLWTPSASSPAGALTALLHRLKFPQSTYWQALFKVSGSSKGKNLLGNEESVPDGIELIDFSWVFHDPQRLEHHVDRVHKSIQTNMDLLSSPSRFGA